MKYDIIVIGAGPAGMTAALYAARADRQVLLLEKESFGGQVVFSPKIENYPGFLQMSGNEFADKLIEQVLEQGVTVELDEATEIRDGETKTVVCASGAEYACGAVIIATGSKHRMLGLENEESFVGNGISFCAVCDGAFYQGQNVAVIGGGNSALQEAVLLSDLCQKVTIVQNLEYLTGEGKLISLLQGRDNVEYIYGATVEKFLGSDELTGLILDQNGTKVRLDVDGVFVAIGQVPVNDAFAPVAELDARGYVIAGEDCLTKTPGVFVAGDCRTKSIRQITTACGDGAVAAMTACRYLGEQ
ncbi:MAG: FAD-dependent oxidoreductase [Clostridia bacterium]|nr:FAD-dependent oxidoreductase [Clostridia bacterium]MBQ5793412.1 FAD-dependent oxidoreductase [Clostridia bacterium]